ncbi:hypothetical protein JI435_117600, partial [Parastagonospora nodorum SN15]
APPTRHKPHAPKDAMAHLTPSRPLTPSSEPSPAAPCTANDPPHSQPVVDFSPATVPYNESFENELMNLLLNPPPTPSAPTPLTPNDPCLISPHTPLLAPAYPPIPDPRPVPHPRERVPHGRPRSQFRDHTGVCGEGGAGVGGGCSRYGGREEGD